MAEGRRCRRAGSGWPRYFEYYDRSRRQRSVAVSYKKAKFMIVDLAGLSPIERQHFLQTSVAPRPICFASTIDSAGRVNLSPFSFFNLFSTNPPILVFSPSRRVRDNTTKHTWHNVLEVPEVVINIVDYPMVQQA